MEIGIFRSICLPVFWKAVNQPCFQEILEEGNFEDGLRTLYLMTEEGEKEVDEMLLRHNKVDTVLIEDEEDLTEDKCKELVKQYKPARIVIEVNGMWDLVKLIRNHSGKLDCCADFYDGQCGNIFCLYQ